MVEVVVPYGGACAFRARALEWTTERLAYACRLATARPGPWSKGAALWPAIRESPADVIALHDADVWTPLLDTAVMAVRDLGFAWARPHAEVYRLSRDGTAALLAGGDWRDQPLERPAYRGMSGGGIVVARREVLLDCPVDPRFIGRGGSDESHAMALWRLHGPPWEGEAPLVHLWHPAQARTTRRYGARESWALRNRYVRACHDPAMMLSLLTEAHVALQPAVAEAVDRPAVGLG
jgi:hypothetical protein